ncbi:hypothetical protein XO10_03695 [Marinitoga sp. 1135]|uniref:hypothetical protein n=1 Tax=Marinitoga sp. 1135 TaxID=1643333 RepID=UPI0015865023|nr:hypothetical protein [Marinitoga sp. 1135]NUU95403.1 hypothetical protein [Marinitoga sp. 1135]
MKKTLVFLLAGILGIFLLTGCLTKEKVEEESTDTTLTLAELRAKILENKDVWTDFNSHNTIYETEGIIAFLTISSNDPKYNIIYVVDENGENGIDIYYLDKDEFGGKFNVGDKIKIKGIPYYKYSDYRMSVNVDGGEISVVESNYGVPIDKAKIVTSALEEDDYGNLVNFTGKYIGDDDYSNKKFIVNGEEVWIYKVFPVNLTLNSTYTIKGVVGQNYGYKVFVGDESWVTLVEEGSEEEITLEASTVEDIREEIEEHYKDQTDGWDTGNSEIVPLRKIENMVVVYDASSFGDVMAVNENGLGLYLEVDEDVDINLNDKITVTGRPYYDEYTNDEFFDYNFKVTRSDEEIVVAEKNSEIPWDKAVTLTADNLPTEDNYENLERLVVFEGSYLGKDGFGHYEFDIDNNSEADIIVYKYSEVPTFTEGKTYEIKGILSYYHGFKVFVGDPSFVTEK